MHTPSFSVSKTHGAYVCFNASCGESGTLIDLVRTLTSASEFGARRLILKCRDEKDSSYASRIKKPEPKVLTEFPQLTLDRLHTEFLQSSIAQEYMTGRGFEMDTLKEFTIGYSAKNNMVTVPMFDTKSMPVGLIGRSLADKRFKNSPGLPTSKTLWNIHKAKKAGDSVVITEASFDAMRVHQAGFPNVVACLGGNFSSHHAEQLDRTFKTIIIMTDFDKKQIRMACRSCIKNGMNLCVGHNPGRDLGNRIVEMLPRKRILWASYGDREVYPDGAKDAGDMKDSQIRQCLQNAVGNFQYQRWNLY